jgi:hypothetical protein
MGRRHQPAGPAQPAARLRRLHRSGKEGIYRRD